MILLFWYTCVLFNFNFIEQECCHPKCIKLSIETTIDHTWEVPEEKARILKRGGRVKQAYPNVGPYRVYHKTEDHPGLAMTRSIGDHEARSLGVIPTPDIYKYSLKRKHSVLIIASDGIFEVLSNKEIADLVWKFRDKPGDMVAQNINKEAYSKWKLRDSSIDDCTCVVVFLNPLEED